MVKHTLKILQCLHRKYVYPFFNHFEKEKKYHKPPLTNVLRNRRSEKFNKANSKTSMTTLQQVLSCEFCQVFQNNFFTEYLNVLQNALKINSLGLIYLI